MNILSKYLFQDGQDIKSYQDGWSIVGNAPVTKEMFDEYGIEDLSVIDNEAIQELESNEFELLCWTEEQIGEYEDIILGEVEFLQSEKVQVESKRLRIEAVPHGQLAMPVEDIEIDGKVEIEVLEDGEETSLIPAMTNSTSPSGIVSHSSAWSPDHQGWEVFDKKKELSSAWATAGGSKSGWVQYDFQKPVIVSKYVLTSRENTSGESPRDWTFEGSNDGTNWTVLDTITGETGWTSFEDREYYIDNTNAYQIYRLNISNNNGHTFIALCELDMIEIKNPGIIRIIASNDSGLSWRGKEEVDITNTSTIIEHGWTAQELNNLTEEELQSVFPEGKGRLAFYLEKDNTTDIAEIKSITINQRTYTITPSVESVSVLYDLLEGEGSSIYVSRNDGEDWLTVNKDELAKLSSLPEGKDLRVKVILEDGQELHGLSYSWI